MSREPVKLNIYDMYWMNDYISNIGIGVFHTGVEVYGCEYSYGGHPLDATGIFENTPRDSAELGDNFRFRETVLLGYTDFTQQDVETLSRAMSSEFPGNKYHLITRNCNHFSSQFSKTLCGSDVPQWVNRLAQISNSIPFLERMLPPEWLTPVALQESLDRQKMEDNQATIVGQRLANNGGAGDSGRLEVFLAANLNFPQSSQLISSVNCDSNSTNASCSGDASPGLLQRMLNKASGVLNNASSSSSPVSTPSTARRANPNLRTENRRNENCIGGQMDAAEQALDALEHMTLSGSNSRASTIAQCDESELVNNEKTSPQRLLDQFR